MAKKRMYSFAKEKHSGKGILSTILGTLSLVIFAVLAWLAYYLDGQGGVYLGSIGLLGMVFAVSSVVFGLMGFGENNVRYLFPKIGFEHFVKGCPPTEIEIYEYLKKYLIQY